MFLIRQSKQLQEAGPEAVWLQGGSSWYGAAKLRLDCLHKEVLCGECITLTTENVLIHTTKRSNVLIQ